MWEGEDELQSLHRQRLRADQGQICAHNAQVGTNISPWASARNWPGTTLTSPNLP